MRLIEKSKGGINDRVIAEYVYTVIYNMTPKEKSSLPGYLYRQINNEKRAKKFAYKSSTDQKRELLSYLSIGFFWTLVNLKTITDKQYLGVLKKFQEDYPVASLKEMSERGLCVTNDLEYSFILGQMSQVITSGVYVRNMESMRVGSFIRGWSKRMNISKEAEEIELDAINISKLTDAYFVNQKYVESITGVTEHEFRILNHLYQKRNSYYPIEHIWAKFAGDIPQRKLSFSINKLVKELFIQKHFDWRRKEYSITKLGIQIVHKFNQSLFKSFSF